jgi:hypothetical protein
MRKLVVLTAITMAPLTEVIAQVWKPVHNLHQAKHVVYVTDDIKQADIIGYQVDVEYKAIKPGYIYLAPVWYSKGTPVFFTTNPQGADLKVYWTKDKDKVNYKFK